MGSAGDVGSGGASGSFGIGGPGGIGGGGGGGGWSVNGSGGQGGFGGGGGCGAGVGTNGVGGIGGSPGIPGTTLGTVVGGDGAAFGGAIFVNSGSLTIQGNSTTLGNIVNNHAGFGATAGESIFVNSVFGALSFEPGTGNTVTINESIADSSEPSIPIGNTWTPGSGPGLAVNMVGPGLVQLNGNNTYSGLTSVTGGRLNVNGTVSGGIFVGGGATLGGIGIINGNSLNNIIDGTIAPGNNGVGQLALTNGTYTLASPATTITLIEINPTTASSLLLTNGGTIQLGGTVEVLQDPGTYPVINTYPIIEGPYTGAFFGVTGGLPGFKFSLIYENNLVLLSLINHRFIPTTGLSGNALKVANYLNNYAPIDTLELLVGLTGIPLVNALNSISPARNAFGAFVSQQTAYSLSDLVTRHLDTIRLMRNCCPTDCCYTCEDTGVSLWMSGFGESGYQKAAFQNPSFKFWTGSLIGGLDIVGKNRTLLGGSGGYAHSYFGDNGHAGHGNIDTFFANGYANVFLCDFYISPAIWTFYNMNKNIRFVQFPDFNQKAEAKIIAWQLMPHLEVGYDLDCCYFDLVPFTAVDWSITYQRGYHEKGATPFNATSDFKRCSSVRSETGVKSSFQWMYDWGIFYFRDKLSYVYQAPFNTRGVTTSLTDIRQTFTVYALDRELNLVDVAVDFTAQFGCTNPISLTFAYEGEFGLNYNSNQIELQLNCPF